ncbi:MAG: type I-C CRISPR-associated protein Cas8c/Csd1 [Desulfovibrio sp.]|nr:type I-C CRISPR-associated protein Cas8c/Csd1 [Desulfovibrio sp.]
MILHSLCNYYARMIRDPKNDMPQPGFSSEKISFALSLKPDGTLAHVLDLREGSGNKREAKIMRVPAVVKRSGNFTANFLWDNTGYVLGVDGKGKSERTQKTFAAFRELHAKAAESGHPMLKAVSAFLQGWRPDRFASLPDITPDDMLDTNCVFMWDETGGYIHEQSSITRPLDEDGDAPDEDAVWCLVSGRKAKAARLHPSIKGVRGGQTSGGAIVSFDKDAFTSYDKKRSFNAPVSMEATAAYTTALNYLLQRDHKRCVQIGDASTIFWAEEATPGEELLYALLTGGTDPGGGESKATLDEAAENVVEKKLKRAPKKNGKAESKEERRVAKQVHDLLNALIKGRSVEEALPDIKPDVRFYILGLAPNAARIAVRFWCVESFGKLAENVARHQTDIAIEQQYESQRQYPLIWQLLVETAAQGKTDNINPPLAAGLLKAVLTGASYPQSLLMATISRIRADKKVTYFRAAMLKGCLVRNYHTEVSFMLDETRQDVPYRLGRLFALLEKAQQDAQGSVNATIRDRYIGSASATPKVVFPQLLRLAQHHIAKSEYGGIVERRIQEVMQGIDAFPAHLALEEQGDFFIGYYHQRNANYQKSVKEKD